MQHLFPLAVIIRVEDVITALPYPKGRWYFDAIALDATVISLEGMSGDSTKIMEAIEAEVKRGNKDIRLMLPYDLDMEEANGILGGLDSLDPGSVNLTLIGCKKITFQGFKYCKQLKSVTLPDVTEICESAFAACSRLQKVVFGTPLTKVYGNPYETPGGYF